MGFVWWVTAAASGGKTSGKIEESSGRYSAESILSRRPPVEGTVFIDNRGMGNAKTNDENTLTTQACSAVHVSLNPTRFRKNVCVCVVCVCVFLHVLGGGDDGGAPPN